MPKSRLSAFFTLLVVFASGAVLGAVANRLYMVDAVVTPATRRPTPEEFRQRQVNDMRQRVKLDDAQIAQFNQIMDKTRATFDDIHKQYNAASRAAMDQQRNLVRSILRPDQVVLYNQLVAEHDAARKKREQDNNNKK